MRILISIGIILLFFSCKVIFEPIAESFSNAITAYAQQDTCKKILTAKIINYRIQNGEFPQSEKDLDSINICDEDYKTTLKLMRYKSESKLPDSLRENFQWAWQCRCPEKLDSISLIAYNADSIEIYTRINKQYSDTVFSVIRENRRLYFKSDTLSGIKHLKFTVRSFDQNGKEIKYLRKGESNRK